MSTIAVTSLPIERHVEQYNNIWKQWELSVYDPLITVRKEQFSGEYSPHRCFAQVNFDTAISLQILLLSGPDVLYKGLVCKTWRLYTDDPDAFKLALVISTDIGEAK